jgi:hypothetical protein
MKDNIDGAWEPEESDTKTDILLRGVASDLLRITELLEAICEKYSIPLEDK